MVLLVSVIGVIAVLNTSDNITVTDAETLTANLTSSEIDTVIPSSSDGIVTDISDGSSYIVERRDICVDELYIESVPEYGNCSFDTLVCDELNVSCQSVTREYWCQTGSQAVEKTIRKCQAKGYTISKFKLDTEGYVCSVNTANKDSTLVICDSMYDGNGDGICMSGESCMKYIISSDSIQSYEKNSKDEYLPSDDSYFLNRVRVEVSE